MLPELALALRLQALDRKIATLENEVATLPKHIAEIERRLESHKRKAEADQSALLANQRERKKLDGDIQVHQQKISKLREQMAGAKTNEQYQAFQKEIAYIHGEIRKAEDKTLELMEQAEAVDKNAKTATEELKKQQAHVDAEKARAHERTAVSQKELAVEQAERKAVSAQLEPKFLKEYERIRKKSKNTPIADATEGRCSACHIALRPQFFQDLRRGDQVMYCESCGRLLTYNPVIDLSAEISASQQIA